MFDVQLQWNIKFRFRNDIGIDNIVGNVNNSVEAELKARETVL